MSSKTGLRQPTLKIPLRASSNPRQTEVLGVVGLRCRIDLHVQVGEGPATESMTFVVDSGASYSIIGLDLALRRELPVPPPESETEGRIRAWWHGEVHGYPFDWPVLFHVNAPFGAPAVLGLGGVVKTCQWLFDGTYSPESPYGSLTLSDIR